jgi:riboflavin biosynthesis pyrimidine reductase
MSGPASIAVAPAIERLWDEEFASPGERAISTVLAEAYGGPLRVALRDDRPTVIVNFVSTLDGVVSFATPEAAGGGEVSGFFAPDQFVMGLLRALADVVLIGAGTLRGDPDGTWTPGAVFPGAATAFHELRASLGLRPEPTTVVVSATGELDLSHAGLADPSVPVRIFTTDRGRAALGRRGAATHVSIEVLGNERVDPRRLIAALAGTGTGVVLCEGGPHLLGELLAADLADELFLTVAPQVAGRSPSVQRLSLIEGVAFDVAAAPWWRVASVRRAANHLFLRYRLDPDAAGHGGAS